MDVWSGAHWPYLKRRSGGLLVLEVMKNDYAKLAG